MQQSEASQILLPSSQYHFGIMSQDPVATMSELSRTFGYEWCERIGAPTAVELPDGETVVDLKAWYSRSEPRMEVVQAIPGTVWSPVAGSDLHHLGYWVDDVDQVIADLQQRGYTLEVAGKLPSGERYWAYLRKTSLPRVEIVSTQLRPVMEEYFASGRVPGRETADRAA